MSEASEPPDVVDLGESGERSSVPDEEVKADQAVENFDIGGLESSEIDPKCSWTVEEGGVIAEEDREEGVSSPIGHDSDNRHLEEVSGPLPPQDSSVDADANIQEADCDDRHNECTDFPDTVVEVQSQVPSVETNEDHQDGGTKSKANHDDVNRRCGVDLIVKASGLENPVVDVECQEMDRETEVCDVHMVDVGLNSNHESVLCTSLMQHQVMQGESEVGRVSEMDINDDEDKETSLLKMHKLETTKSTVDGGKSLDSITVDGDKSLDSITVGGIIYQETECVLEDSNLDDLAVKSQSEVRDTEIDGDGRLTLKDDEGKDNEAYAFHMSLVDNDGNNREESVNVSDSVPVEADHFTKDPDHIDLDMKPEVSAGCYGDGDQERDSEASASRPSLLNTSEHIQEEGSTMFSVDVSEAVEHQTDCVAEDKNMIACEGVITTSNELMTLSASIPSLLDTSDHIQEEGSTMFSVDVSEAVHHQTDCVAEDENMIVAEGVITTSNAFTTLSDAEAENVDPNSVIGGPLGSGHSLKSRVHLDQNIADLPVLNADPHPFHQNTTIEGVTTKVGFEDVVDIHYEEDQEASALKMHLVDFTQEDDTLLCSDSGSITRQADCAPPDPDLPDSSVELRAKIKHIDSNAIDGFVQASLTATNQTVQKENDILLNSVPLESDHPMNDLIRINPSVEVKPAIVGGEAEMYDGAEMDVDEDRDREASALKASMVETNQNIAEEEADNGDVNSVNDGPLGSRYPMATGVSLAQNVGDLAAQSADTHPLNENVVVQEEDITKVDADIISDLQSHGVQVINENHNDKDDIAEFVSCSIQETEDDGPGSLGEKHSVTQDSVLQSSNSVVESSTATETQTVLAQGKDTVSLPYDKKQDIEAQSVGTLVDEDPGANSPKLEFSLGKRKYAVTDSEDIENDMPSPITCENVESNQVSQTKQETLPPSNSASDVPMDEGADGKQNIQVRKGELLKETDQSVQSVPPSIGIAVMENKQHISYHLPSVDKAKFSTSELVWGKVKSHPWWPGQIIDPSDASQLALKYQKKENFLVAYFGDKTFAWCDKSQLKPFCSNFFQMEKQSSSDTFVTAVNGILAEISRRAELGMTCSCLPEETCANIKFQKIDNAGVRRGNVNSNLDRPLILNYFQPGGLLEYVKTLAQFPNGSVDRLELVIAKSQLKAFYCSKGYPQLHAFTDRGLIEDVAMISPSTGKASREGTAKQSNPAISDLIVGKGKLRSIENSSKKRKHVLEEGKKQKSTSDLTHEEDSLHLRDDVLETSENLISNSVVKPTTFGSDSLDSVRHKKRTLDFFGDTEPTSPSPTLTSSFKIGEFIRRAASQLTGAPPFVKCQQETNQKSIPNDHNRGDATDFDVLPHIPEENKGGKTSLTESNSSPNEMLSQLCLAASDPMNGNYFVPTMVAFFTSFRNSCVPCASEGNKQVEKRKRGRPRKVIPRPFFAELFSDISSSEDKHGEKRKRRMPKKLDSQPAMSDVSSSEEKQHDNKCSSQEQPVEKRRRGRPKKVVSIGGELKTGPHSKKKVISIPAISDICSSEEQQHVEKRKRGRPKKVIPQLATYDVSTPDHTQNSYWSDTNLQKRPRKNSFSDDRNWIVESHTVIRQKRKSVGWQPLSLSSGSMKGNEHLQLVAMNLDKKHSFLAERPIISVEEKIVKECTPTALILNFSSSTTLPSVTDLIRIFSPYGPVKEAETDFLRKTNCAKVVFKRRADAEAAFSGAGKHCIFGPGLLSYQLKCMPSTPKPARQTNPQVQHDAASTPRQEENNNTSSVTTQDNYNPVATSRDNQPHKHDESLIMTTSQDKHDPTLVSRPLDESVPISTLPEEGQMQGCNIEISDVAECVLALDTIMVEAEAKELSPQDKYYSTSVPQSKDDLDATPTSAPQDKYDATPITSQGSQDATPITRTQDEHDATQIERSNLPQDKHDALLITVTPQDSLDTTLNTANTASQDYQDTILTTTLQENYDAPQEVAETVIASGPELVEAEARELSPQDKYDLISTPEDKHNAVPISTPPDIHDSTPITASEDDHDAAIFTSQDYQNTVSVIRTQDGYDVNESSNLSRDKHDAVLIAEPCVYNDAELIVTPEDSQDAKVNTASQDYQDTTPTTTQENYDATQEVAEAMVASDPEPVEAEAVELSPQEKYDWTFDPQSEGNHDAASIATPQDKHDSAPITTPGDCHDAAPFIISQDYKDAAPEDKYDTSQIESGNLPQDNPDAMLVTEPWAYHDATLIAAPQDSQDATLLTAPQDSKSESPTATLQENYDATQEQSEIMMEADTTQAEEGMESS